MTSFVCIGLDIRKTGPGQLRSADATVWEQEIDLYLRVKSELNIEENALQLLQPKNETEFSLLLEMVKLTDNARLVSFELPLPVFEAYRHHDLIPSMPFSVSGSEWTMLGFDICDINGFFSYLDMHSSSRESLALFDDNHLLEAFVNAQAANLKIPSHAPYVVIRLKTHEGADCGVKEHGSSLQSD